MFVATTKDTADIKAAIERSIMHDETVELLFRGDSGDAIDACRQEWAGEIDYTMCDYEGVDALDIWGWTDETAHCEQDWRLDIRLVDGGCG